jgi:inositol transporter-like SP family MFS transporter
VITSTTAGLGRASGQLLYGVIVVVGIAGLLLRLTVPESPLWRQAREERRRGIHTVRADHVKVRDLFKPPFRRPVIVLVVYYTLMSIAGNVAASYVTYVAVNVSKVPIAEFTAWSLVTVPATFIALGVMMKFIDTRARIPLFVAGGVLFAVGFLVPVVAGIGLTSLVVAFAIAVIGSILCGEPIARVWANESFPTMLRSTGQGFVFTVGRVVVAIVSAVAPAVILLSPQLFFVALAAAALLGTVVAWVGFRGGRVANEFDVESRPEPALLDAA